MKRLLAAAKKMGQIRSYKKGQILMHQGDTLTHLYFVTKGCVKVYNILETGDERLMLLMCAGDAFPITVSIGRGEYQLKYFYEAMTDVKAVVVKQEEVAKYLQHNYQRLTALLEYIAQSNRLIMERLEVMESKSARQKLLKVLPYLVEKIGKPLGGKKFKLNLKLTHQDLANMTGLTRETASIQLKQLENEGTLSTRGGYITINFAKQPIELERVKRLDDDSLAT